MFTWKRCQTFINELFRNYEMENKFLNGNIVYCERGGSLQENIKIYQ